MSPAGARPTALLAQRVDQPVAPAEEVTQTASSMVETVAEALPRVGLAVVVVLVGWILDRAVRWGLRSWLRRRRTPSFANVMSKVGGWAVLAIAVFAALAVAFPSVQPVDLLAGLGIFSLAIGFAFQDILENTLSGVLLLFRQPFRSGDQVRVLDQEGTVEAITIRETRIITFDGELVVVPNRDVYKSVIVVPTHGPIRRLSFEIGIAYENDARQAVEVVTAALATVEGVASQPAPQAIVTELGVSTVDIRATVWADSREGEALLVLHDAITTVKEALDARGIEMPADIVALQATPSLRAALQGDADVTPGGGVRPAG